MTKFLLSIQITGGLPTRQKHKALSWRDPDTHKSTEYKTPRKYFSGIKYT